MLIVRWYSYLFYRVYLWRCSRPKTPISQPAIDAALFIAIANIFYVFGIGFIFAAFSETFSHLFFENFDTNKIVVFVFGVLAALFHIYIFVWSSNFKTITNEFKDSKVTKLGTGAVIFYMAFSYFFVIAAGLLSWPSIHDQLPRL